MNFRPVVKLKSEKVIFTETSFLKMEHQHENEYGRNAFLSALCILTFIGSGIGILTYLLASLFFKAATEIIVKFSMMHSTDAISPFYFTLFMALSAVSLTGAIRMWKLHRDGFYFYTAAQILMLVLPVIWLGWDSFSAPGAIFTLVFMGGYGLNWKWMK